jgi:error-prone DNA polymerase
MATFKAKGMVTKFQEKLITGMTARGYTAEFAQRVFKQLEGFGSYGFPESHAASFALLVYVSSWLKWYYADVFACSLLNSMPMGFYQPAQIVIDAKNHGVEVRPVDINYSYWDNTLEEKAGKFCALRLGFRQVKGVREEDVQVMLNNRKKAFNNIYELRDLQLPDSFFEKLADADSFRSLGLDRRQALWEFTTKDTSIELFRGQQPAEAGEENVQLPQMSISEHVVQDYASVSLSLKAHPVIFIREKLDQLHITPVKQLAGMKNGDLVKVTGLVLVRQRPGTSKGVIFMTIEDETGWANLVVFKNVFDAYRREILQSRLIMVEGKLQIEGEVIHVVVSACYNFSKLLRHLTASQKEQAALSTLPRGDEKPEPGKLFGEARNFK